MCATLLAAKGTLAHHLRSAQNCNASGVCRALDRVPAEVRQLLWRVETIEIDVKYHRARRHVLLNQGIRWAGNFFFDSVAPTDCLGESGFSNPQLTRKCYDERRRNRAPQLLAPVAQFLFGDLEVALVSSRRNDVPVSWHH